MLVGGDGLTITTFNPYLGKINSLTSEAKASSPHASWPLIPVSAFTR